MAFVLALVPGHITRLDLGQNEQPSAGHPLKQSSDISGSAQVCGEVHCNDLTSYGAAVALELPFVVRSRSVGHRHVRTGVATLAPAQCQTGSIRCLRRRDALHL